MTDKEALAKDAALAEIMMRLDKLRRIQVSYPGMRGSGQLLDIVDVKQLIQEYGFNDTPYATPDPRKR